MFDDLTDVYEAMINWPKRLGHEGPFYRRLFQQHGVRSVLDAACGTGHHAAMFHDWGLEVEGADISPAMIDRARALWRAPGATMGRDGFDKPIASPEPFDAVVCLGNSLPLAPDMATVQRAIIQMLGSARRRPVGDPRTERLAFARRPVRLAKEPVGRPAPRRCAHRQRRASLRPARLRRTNRGRVLGDRPVQRNPFRFSAWTMRK